MGGFRVLVSFSQNATSFLDQFLLTRGKVPMKGGKELKKSPGQIALCVEARGGAVQRKTYGRSFGERTSHFLLLLVLRAGRIPGRRSDGGNGQKVAYNLSLITVCNPVIFRYFQPRERHGRDPKTEPDLPFWAPV